MLGNTIHMASGPTRYNLMEKIKTGEYFYPMPILGHGTIALAANWIYAIPFVVERNITIDRLAIQVTSASGAGTEARLGLYKDGTNLYPGELVVDAGVVATDANTVVAASISESLDKGLYFLVIASESTPTLMAFVPAWTPIGYSASGFGLTQDKHYYKSGVGFGALADPFVSGATAFGAWHPAILPRLLTLD